LTFPPVGPVRVRAAWSRVWGFRMCSGSEAGSYLRLIDFVYHSTLGLRVIKQKKRRFRVGDAGVGFRVWVLGFGD